MALYEEIEIDQGTDVSIELQLINIDGTPKDLTGYSAQSKMKKSYTSDSADTYNFTALIANPATDGILNLSMTNFVTDNIPAGRYLYDVEISFQDSASNSIIERILEGRITVTPSVTK